MSQHSGHCRNWPEGDFGRGPATELCETCNLDAKEREAEAWQVARDAIERMDPDAFCMPSWTCSEAEALAEAFRALDLDDLAETFMEAHVATDEPGDEHYDDPAVGTRVTLDDGTTGEVVETYVDVNGDGRDQWLVRIRPEGPGGLTVAWADECTIDSDDVEEQPRSEEYCDYCETEGHTFRACARRDDDVESFA